ncbi:MAG: MarR family transcriptional regulator [Elusimicrobia bacterium]|nr:MarR family transcriptional regulator [Elusimicrobiota bacterium]
MSLDDKARRLTHDLQTVLEGVSVAEHKNPAVAEQLSAQEIRVLNTVGCEECCIMSTIAGAIRLSLSSVTGLIDRLVEKKLVRRDRSSEDRRTVQVELTKEGRELHEAAMQGRVEFARDLLTSLSADEQEALVSLFGKISQRIKTEKKQA